MSELTIEQKAKLYDEAIERARKWFEPEDSVSYTGIVESIFPELRESEDERIVKCLLNYFHHVRYNGLDLKGTDVDEVIAWLEKQGKQKSIWHNEDEEPQRGRLILLFMQSGTPVVAKIIEPNHTFNHGERWAYIDDLLEKRGDKKELIKL